MVVAKRFYLTGTINVIFFLFLLTPTAHAEMNWASVTLDNDLFIGHDSGYTNGLYLSLYDTGDQQQNATATPDLWVKPLLWSMAEENVIFTVNSYMLGHTMMTPRDISLSDPPQDELPYSALLAVTNTYLVVTPKYADSASTTLGIVGPAAFGEEIQTFVHKVIGAEKPQGWDTQLENEPVFQFSRARAWRSWVSAAQGFDFITTSEISLGTLQSDVAVGGYLRYGTSLLESYATVLFQGSRTSNPLGIDGGWNVYVGLQAGYVFNRIYTDGNTFRSSRSIDYSREFISGSVGLAYSWKNYSITLALTDANIARMNNDEDLDNLTQFGTLTFAWRL